MDPPVHDLLSIRTVSDARASEGATVEIRWASAEDLPAIAVAFPGRAESLHEERLAHQEAGHGPYLIAWLDGAPAGHVQLQLPDERDLDAMLEGRGAAWVEDLWVEPTGRGRWIGPALMRTVEEDARRAGVSRLVFFAGVHAGYAAARAIYAWMGWREARPEPFIESSTVPDGHGDDTPYVEVVTMWTKRVR
jgi:GNAT superfamily N-acetyltransferase